MIKKDKINEVRRLQKIAGLLKEDSSGEDLQRGLSKLSSQMKLGADYPFKNKKEYTWEDFNTEVRKQNPDPFKGTPKEGKKIYIKEYEDAESVISRTTREEELYTWKEIIDSYLEEIQETYGHVEDFAKVFTMYEWHGPFKDLTALVYEVTLESRQGIVDVITGAVANFQVGEAFAFAVLDTTEPNYGEVID